MTPLALLAQRGGQRYDGEGVTQLEHALQSAHLAQLAGATERLVLAALLHDVGHLLRDHGGVGTVGRDLRHEHMGARWLGRWFAPSITEPIRLHVQAKRFLARDTGYAQALSEESKRSLVLQGGPFTEAEARRFEAQAFAEDAMTLRRCDDQAKREDWIVPGLDTYHSRLRHWMDGR